MIWVVSALAADLWVGPGMPYADVEAALTASSPGDRVLLLPGSYEAVLDEAVGVDLVGVGGAEVTTVTTAVAPIWLLSGTSVTARRLTLDGQTTGRLVDISASGQLTLDEVRLVGGFSTDAGGCIVSRGSLDIDRSEVDGCTSDDNAGGIYALDGTFGLTRSRVNNNTGRNGGGILCLRSDCVVEDSAFEGNFGDRGGALFYWNGGTSEVHRTSFCSNIADIDAAGLRVRNTDAWVSNAAFVGNTAVFDGAHIDVIGLNDPASVLVEHSTFLHGSVDFGEGAVHGDDQAFVDVRTSLFGNHVGSPDIVVEAGATGALTDVMSWGNPDGVSSLAGGTLDDASLVSDTNQCDPAGWGLVPGSPAIDAGSGQDADGSAADLGATGGPTPLEDADQDGHFAPWDCDDADDTVFPGAVEICNDRDDDCDFAIDEGIETSDFFIDLDGDGYGSVGPIALCSAFYDLVDNDADCDDTSAARNPDALESCNGLDDDCNGQVDDGTPQFDFFEDADGDGYGAGDTVQACAAPPGYSDQPGDCDDADPTRSPGRAEQCNDIDDDCDGSPDDGLTYQDYWPDADGDGYGTGTPVSDCAAFPGFAAQDGDCDDASSAVNPGEAERCTGIDDDCDGAIDEDAIDAFDTFVDADGDGFGAGLPTTLCAVPAGSSDNALDCDDGDAAVSPDALESCNTVDDDCDGTVDEDDAVDVQQLFADADMDGYGDPDTPVLACPGEGRVSSNDDCDDTDPAINPGAEEEPGNTVDENCDGENALIYSEDTGRDVDPSADKRSFCGCGSSGPTAGWLAVFAGLALLRRRQPCLARNFSS